MLHAGSVYLQSKRQQAHSSSGLTKTPAQTDTNLEWKHSSISPYLARAAKRISRASHHLLVLSLALPRLGVFRVRLFGSFHLRVRSRCIRPRDLGTDLHALPKSVTVYVAYKQGLLSTQLHIQKAIPVLFEAYRVLEARARVELFCRVGVCVLHRLVLRPRNRTRRWRRIELKDSHQ